MPSVDRNPVVEDGEVVTLYFRMLAVRTPEFPDVDTYVPDIPEHHWCRVACPTEDRLGMPHGMMTNVARVLVKKADFDAGAFPNAIEPSHGDRAMIENQALPIDANDSNYRDGPEMRRRFTMVAQEIRAAGGSQADVREAIAAAAIVGVGRGLREIDAIRIAGDHGIGVVHGPERRDS